MDSREASQPPPNMLMGGPASYSTNTMIPQPSSTATAAARFQFSSLAVAPQSPQSQSQPQQHAKPLDSLGFDGSPSFRSSGGGFAIDPNKKKRGRPRKYTPDGNIALRLAPAPSPASHADSGAVVPANSASDPPAKRNRGRPPGSGKKQLDALGGVGGSGFTPHVISVKAGEDIASKVMAFSQQGPRTVFILSANGAVCNVTLRQPANSMSGGTVTYEGRFEIISLSGSFSHSENNGGRRNETLSVSLAGPDGRVLGGGVAGMLMAASPVQIILGSFIADGKKSNSSILQPGASSAPIPHMLNFGAPVTSSPPSQGASSESSDDNGSSPSPLNRTGIYNNPGQPPLHSMQMYQLWAGQTQQ